MVLSFLDLISLTTLSFGPNSFPQAKSLIMDGMPAISQMSFDEGSMKEVVTIQFAAIGSSQSSPSFQIMNNTFDVLQKIMPDEYSELLADEFLQCLPSAIRNQVTIDTDPVLSHQIASVRNRTEFESLPEDVRVLTFEPDSCNEEEFTSLDLTPYVRLQTITVGENALTRVTHVDARQLRELDSIIVEENGLPNASSFMTDLSSRVTRTVIINSQEDLNMASISITELIIADGGCNEIGLTELDLRRFVNVREIIIGSGALQHVTKVIATGLVRLRLFEIGIGSLPLVTDFSIDLSSVVTWTYIARTKNLLVNAPIAISQLVIPDNSCNDVDFTEWDLNDYKNLRQVVIGVNSLKSVITVNGNKLIDLSDVSIGYGSLPSIQSLNIRVSSISSYRVMITSKVEILSAPSLLTTLSFADNSCNEDDFTELDLRRFVNVHEIVIGSNSLLKVTKVRATGLRKLVEFDIGDGSLPMATDFSITSSSMITWPYLVNTCSEFLQSPSIITELTIAENTCNESNLTSIDFSRFINLQKISIGRHSFKHVTSVNAIGMDSLQSLIIGSGSLPLVTSLGIEGTTHVEWKYSVATKSAFMSAPTGITDLTITSNGCNEADFTSLDLSRFPLLHSLTIGSSALTHVRSIEGSRPVHLSSVKIGEGSLSQLPPTIVNSTISLSSLPWYTSELVVLDNTWNDVVMLDLRDFSLLKQITVGTNALKNVREIHLETLPLIESLVICDQSLTSNYLFGFSFVQMNNLKTIQIGKNSLTHPTSIQFNGLPSLHTLSIGEGSFGLVETVVIANNTLNNPLFVELNLNSLVNMKNMEVNENSLQYVRTLDVSKSNSLQSLVVK